MTSAALGKQIWLFKESMFYLQDFLTGEVKSVQAPPLWFYSRFTHTPHMENLLLCTTLLDGYLFNVTVSYQ